LSATVDVTDANAAKELVQFALNNETDIEKVKKKKKTEEEREGTPSASQSKKQAPSTEVSQKSAPRTAPPPATTEDDETGSLSFSCCCCCCLLTSALFTLIALSVVRKRKRTEDDAPGPSTSSMPTIVDTFADEEETVVDQGSMNVDQQTERVVHVTRERSATFRTALAQLGQSGREEALSFDLVLQTINQVPPPSFFSFSFSLCMFRCVLC